MNKLDVFISWAGARSQALAEALRMWLPMVINAIEPWLSSSDIDSGARWASEVAGTLERAKFGIICLTPKSMRSEWVLFEAGALSKTINGTYVCPLLVDLSASDVTGPLAQFQARKAEFAGIWKLVETMNGALGEQRLPDAQLKNVFDALWPILEGILRDLPSDDGPAKPAREVRDMIEEVLDIVRAQSQKDLATDIPIGNWTHPDRGAIYCGGSYEAAVRIQKALARMANIGFSIEQLSNDERVSHLKIPTEGGDHTFILDGRREPFEVAELVEKAADIAVESTKIKRGDAAASTDGTVESD